MNETPILEYTLFSYLLIIWGIFKEIIPLIILLVALSINNKLKNIALNIYALGQRQNKDIDKN